MYGTARRRSSLFSKSWEKANIKSFLSKERTITLDLLSQYPQEEWNGGKVRRISGSLLKLERGEVFELEGKRFFAFGGGESPEMDLRAADGTWWQQELPSVEEVQRARENLAAC